MGEFTNKTMGKAKKAVGRATGDRDLEGRGRRQEPAGKVQGGVKTVGRKLNRGLDKLAGKAAPRRSVRPKAAAARPGRTTKTTRTTKTVEQDF